MSDAELARGSRKKCLPSLRKFLIGEISVRDVAKVDRVSVSLSFVCNTRIHTHTHCLIKYSCAIRIHVPHRKKKRRRKFRIRDSEFTEDSLIVRRARFFNDCKEPVFRLSAARMRFFFQVRWLHACMARRSQEREKPSPLRAVL